MFRSLQTLRLYVPTEREIVWVVGEVGLEGKAWFQKHLTINKDTDDIK